MKQVWERLAGWVRSAWEALRGWVMEPWDLRSRHEALCHGFSEQQDLIRAQEEELDKNEDALRRMEQRLETETAAVVVPGLTAAEIERLAFLAEECGAVVQAVGKVMRHGWRSASPFGGPINRVTLEREMGNVRAVIDMMIAAGDVRSGDVQEWRNSKRLNAGRWMHHQPPVRP